MFYTAIRIYFLGGTAMCGIIGYSGSENAAERIISGLKSLEYRGYDSAGIAAFEENKVRIIKTVGRVSALEHRIDECGGIRSGCGIGHTRWATHGAPNDINSHPQVSGRVVLVHNGIIENYHELKTELISQGVSFVSETDTEVAAAVIDSEYNKAGDPLKAILAAMPKLTGSYAFGILFKDVPGVIYSVKKGSPLIVGVTDNGGFISSDTSAILRYTKKYISLENGEIAVIKGASTEVYNSRVESVKKEILTAKWDAAAAEKGGYAHFMLKEIHEEPEAVKKTLGIRNRHGYIDFEDDGITVEQLKNINFLRIVACGTAMHAGLYAKYAIEKMARIPVIVEVASEFRYSDPILSDKDTVLIISQSGETADSLEALRIAKSKGARTIAVVNVIASSIAREADNVIYTYAGPEISVASTKAYTVQVATLCAFAFELAYSKGRLTEQDLMYYSKIILHDLCEAIEKVISDEERIRGIAQELYDNENVFFIGRSLDCALVQEASLKLKEISYIHSEAYAAGELKHGTISLITNGTPVISLATVPEIYEKTMSNIVEVVTRGGKAFVVCGSDFPDNSAILYRYELPEIDRMFMGLVGITAMQLFAYYMSVLRGNDVDKPRNLAKSVTVE